MIQLCTDRNSIQIHVHVREVLRSTQNPPPPRLVVPNVLYEFCLAKLHTTDYAPNCKTIFLCRSEI